MTVQTKAVIKSYFVRGAKPTAQNFIDLIDSYQDTGSSDAFTPIGQALVNASSQSSAQSAIGLSYVTTAQAVAGGVATGSMNPVLVKNQILNYGYTTGAFATTAAAVSGQAASGYINPVLVRNAFESFGAFATTAAAVSGQATTGYMNPVLVKNAIASYSTGGKKILGRTRSSTRSLGSGSTRLPEDNTVPTSSEGDEVLTASYTPISATSKLIIEYKTYLSNPSLTGQLTAALFQDSGASAIDVSSAYAFNTSMVEVYGKYEMTSGSTTATTFKLRVGGDSSTTYWNQKTAGGTGSPIYGGSLETYIEITEIEA